MKFYHFTLVELLVVIAIISILAALMLPTLQSAMNNAQSAACISNHKQLSLAFSTYAGDFNNEFPYYANTNGHIGAYPTIHFRPTAGASGYDTWVSWIKVYAGEMTTANALPSIANAAGIFDCPTNPRVKTTAGRGSNYAYNYECQPNWKTATGTPASARTLRIPSAIVATIDAGINPAASSATLAANLNWEQSQAGYNGRYVIGVWHAEMMTNASFVDAHVETVALKIAGSAPELPREYYAQGRQWTTPVLPF